MTQATPPRSWWAAVFDLGPHAGAHWTALRASLAILVPLVACWASGRSDLLLYAAIGAFTALYGRHEPARIRLAMQAQVGAVLVVGVVVGALVATVPFRLWLLVPVAAAWAGAAVVLAELGRWHPAGALNPVFALTASATVPIPLSTVPAAALAAAGAAVFALLLALPGRTARTVRAGGEPVPHRLSWRDLRPSDPVGRHAARYLLGIAVAGLAVATSGIGHPYWTFVTASVPMSAPDLHARLTRAAQRVIGTGPRRRSPRPGRPPHRLCRDRRHRRAPGVHRADHRAQLQPRPGLLHPDGPPARRPHAASLDRHPPDSARPRDRHWPHHRPRRHPHHPRKAHPYKPDPTARSSARPASLLLCSSSGFVSSAARCPRR